MNERLKRRRPANYVHHLIKRSHGQTHDTSFIAQKMRRAVLWDFARLLLTLSDGSVYPKYLVEAAGLKETCALKNGTRTAIGDSAKLRFRVEFVRSVLA